MTKGANSGPAIMMMPNHIRATFMPNPPLKYMPPLKLKRKKQWSGVSSYLTNFEKDPKAPESEPMNPKKLKEAARKKQNEKHQKDLEPMVADYRNEQRECGGEYEGMNCYNTLFVGRLAFEVTERKLLRELEVFGPIKDLKLVQARDGKSRGYAFVEFEHEEDMKRAYRAADAMKMEGREIVVDVERGHTVPNWLPRRLGGGLGGTRLGGKDKNVSTPGRFDPSRPEASRPVGGMGRGGGGPPGYGGGGGGFGRGGGGPGGHGSYSRGPGGGGRERYGPPRGRDWDRGGGGGGRYSGGGGGGDWNRKRNRSRSPDRRYSGSRRRY